MFHQSQAKAQPGRKKEPLNQKVSRALDLDVASELRAASYPDPGLECWPGPRQLFHEGRPHATARLVFTLLYSERIQRARLGLNQDPVASVPLEHLGVEPEILDIDPRHHVRRTCSTTNCCNPHHHQLQVVWNTSGEAPPPIPFEFLIMPEPDDLNDAIDTILMIEDGRSFTPQQLVERFDHAYDETTFQRALEVIREQGL